MTTTPTRGAYLARQPWFVGRDADVERVQTLPWIRDPESGLGVRYELVRVRSEVGTRVYNVPASYRALPVPGLGDALMEVVDGRHVYDAMQDPQARSALLAGFGPQPVPHMEYRAEAPLALAEDTPTTLLHGEQRNTSALVGRDLIWKLFRIIEPGANPEVELGRALTGAASTEVPLVRASVHAGPYDLAVVSEHYAPAANGWDAARDFARAAAESSVDASGVFVERAFRLGETVAALHRRLADHFGTATIGGGDLAGLSAHLSARFDAAVGTTPSLAEHREQAHAAFADLTGLTDGVTTQRIHGDLHLGQTLLAHDGGWKVIDFEGEPERPLAERARFDSPLRDVAGMLRSFDYAPHSMRFQQGVVATDPRTTAWTARSSAAFLQGYGIAQDPAAAIVTRAFGIDKAAVEVAYESRHRPQWRSIPDDALRRLLQPEVVS